MPFDSECKHISDDAFRAIEELLTGAQNIALCAHTGPDGDALGSELALAMAIQNRWPEKSVVALLADNTPLSSTFSFLPGAAALTLPQDYSENPDVFVCLDLSEAERLGEARAILERAQHVIVLDHHPCTTPFGDAFIILPDEAAASVVVADVIDSCHFALTQDIAQCLLCGIMCDTGNFQYQNTNKKALYIAGDMVSAGGQAATISLHLNQSRSYEEIALEARCMMRLKTAAHGQIAYSYVTREDMLEVGASDEDASNLVDAVRSLKGTRIALMVRELPSGMVRCNLRAKDSTDISLVAAMFGGGGHAAAAGFTCSGSCVSVMHDVLEELENLLNAAKDDE